MRLGLNKIGLITLSVAISGGLSGCGYITGGQYGHQAQQGNYSQLSYQYNGGPSRHAPCQIQHAQQPIPQGCDPAQVTIGVGGFPQQAQFGAPQQMTGGYGSHAGDAHNQANMYNAQKPRLRKPRLRGSLSLGLEQSISGDFLNYNDAGIPVGAAVFNPQDYNEGFSTGSPADGSVTTTTYTANDREPGPGGIYTPFGVESISAPDISIRDVYSTPTRIAGGLEYILGKKTTVFANGGYSRAEGASGTASTVDATLYQDVTQQAFIEAVDAAGNTIPGAFVPNGPAGRNVSFIPNQTVARFNYDFTDMERVDLEIGARQYFNPIARPSGTTTLTPFVGVSGGMSYYNDASVEISQEQLFYQRAFDNGGQAAGPQDFYQVTGSETRTQLYDSQWVPSGQINAGMEWQVTPKTALALETGIRMEGARDYSNGREGDTNISVPVTLRGSFNF